MTSYMLFIIVKRVPQRQFSFFPPSKRELHELPGTEVVKSGTFRLASGKYSIVARNSVIRN